jgi:cupin fold WbuC family metalloprotein
MSGHAGGNTIGHNSRMKLFPRSLLDELTTKATASPRARAHFTVHAGPSDPVQRFFVVANRGTYFRPHRHNTKSELAVVVRGRFDVILFDPEGRVTARYTIGDGTPSLGYEAAQGTWHTLLADTDGAAFFEVKEGPYDPATSSEFASWAPPEGHESVPTFLEWLKSAQVGDLAPVAGTSAIT